MESEPMEAFAFSSRATGAAQVPIWAHEWTEGMPLNRPNLVLASKPDSTARPKPAATAPAPPPPSDGTREALEHFLLGNILDRPDAEAIAASHAEWEIEAKLGMIVDRDTGDRVRANVPEFVLASTSGTAFRSSMTIGQHYKENMYLNQRVAEPRPQTGAGGAAVRPWKYKHLRETDRFLELPDEMARYIPPCILSQMNRRRYKLRATYDTKTGALKRRIIKARIADMDICMSGEPLDCRVTISLEMPWTGPTGDIDRMLATQQADHQSPIRHKDRMTYSQWPLQVDLTQVRQESAGSGPDELEHELEVELNAQEVIKQAMRAMSGDNTRRFSDLTMSFLDRIRKLNRNAGPPEMN